MATEHPPTPLSHTRLLITVSDPRQTWLSHLNHDIDYNALKVPLPAGVELAYDGLAFDIVP